MVRHHVKFLSFRNPRVDKHAQDVILGLGFVCLAVASLRRLLVSVGQEASETVITTFYSLICFTSVVRAVWFFIPDKVRRAHVRCVTHAVTDRTRYLYSQWPSLTTPRCLLSLRAHFSKKNHDQGMPLTREARRLVHDG